MAGMWVWERPGPRSGAHPGLPDGVLWPKAVRGQGRWDGMGPEEPPHMAACSRCPLTDSQGTEWKCQPQSRSTAESPQTASEGFEKIKRPN